MDNGLQVQLFGRQDREALAQIKAHLVPEHRDRAGAGAIGFLGAMLLDMAHEIEILLHGKNEIGLPRLYPRQRGASVSAMQYWAGDGREGSKLLQRRAKFPNAA